jgi:hypothetical protein
MAVETAGTSMTASRSAAHSWPMLVVVTAHE